ncbi:hypothetical protein VB741_25350, partial [Leptothoe sp. PORK10 BA2]
MAKKVALLIGVGEYGNGLKPLRCPANGVGAMQVLLENPNIGGFDEVLDSAKFFFKLTGAALGKRDCLRGALPSLKATNIPIPKEQGMF